MSSLTRFRLLCLASVPLGITPVVAQEVDCDTFPFNLVFHAYPITEPTHQTTDLLLESDEIRIARGGRAEAYASVVSQLGDGPGVQGIVLAVNVNGNVELSYATLEGTASAPSPEGIVEPGNFAYVDVIDPEVIHPDDGKPQGQGAVLAVTYSIRSPVTLVTTGTSNVFAMGLQAPEDVEPEGELVFRDNLAFGEPAENVLTVFGESRRPGPPEDPLACTRKARVVEGFDSRFVRGDTDGNGIIELTDGIRIHGFLFLGQPESLDCKDAADLNDSGHLDISDGILVFMFLFLGGDDPAPPFPSCGFDPVDDDPLSCEEFGPCH